jgi:hypothetical protein
MRKIMVIGIAIVSLALVARAGDPWKDRPFDQWDEKDLHKIMFDSPWAQIVQVDATSWRTPMGTTQPIGRQGAGSDIGGAVGGSDIKSSNLQGEQPAVDQTHPQTANFLIRWASSRVEREAAVRKAILSGRLDKASAEKFLAQEPTDYEIVVAGQDMTPFETIDEGTLGKNTYVKAKKSKEKVAPSKVQIQRDPATKRVTAVLFVFSKNSPGGEPIISPAEKDVVFNCAVGQVTLKYDFEIQRMTYKQGRDL